MASHGGAAAEVGLRRLRNPWVVTPWVLHDPEIKACLSSLRNVGECVSSIFLAYKSGGINLRPECCRAVRMMGEHCFDKVFTSVYFDDWFAPRIRELCASPASAAAPS
ncbi:hypothetical protein GW17_00027499 [Ensete ventricosum]|uniref:Uncharacterized protein n=1 Tax=Ensete ventricosum TaxID=4639 RepID=A0A444EFE6_ENSVE|nr:hypothetical protein B296_00000775 [Ensete ventricosum]RWW09034.1 hypothetical protein GW17_00027499 [Ensete ventricosum]